MLLSSKLFKFIVVAFFLTNTSVVFGNDIEKFASKLFNHYQYDDKINKYLKSFFSFGNPKANKPLETKKGYSKSDTKAQSILLKLNLKIK